MGLVAVIITTLLAWIRSSNCEVSASIFKNRTMGWPNILWFSWALTKTNVLPLPKCLDFKSPLGIQDVYLVTVGGNSVSAVTQLAFLGEIWIIWNSVVNSNEVWLSNVLLWKGFNGLVFQNNSCLYRKNQKIWYLAQCFPSWSTFKPCICRFNSHPLKWIWFSRKVYEPFLQKAVWV